jgi:hypothetical protein
MSEYDDEIVDEEQDWGDLDDTSEYDDLGLTIEVGWRRHRWRSKRS